MSGLARTLAVTLTGLTGHIVEVEAHCAPGLPAFTLVGLPDAAVRESRERVRAALSTCGVTWGERRLTVNLSPADLPKTGTGFDVSLALAVLAEAVSGGRSAVLLVPDRGRADHLAPRAQVLAPNAVRPVRTPASFAYQVVSTWRTQRRSPLGPVELVTGSAQDQAIARLIESVPAPWPDQIPAQMRAMPAFRAELRNLFARAGEAGMDGGALIAAGERFGQGQWVAAGHLLRELLNASVTGPECPGALRVDLSRIQALAADLVGSWERDGAAAGVSAPPPVPDVVVVDDLQDCTPSTITLLGACSAAGARVVALSDSDVAVAGYRGGEPHLDLRLASLLGAGIDELDRVHGPSPRIRALVAEAASRVTQSGPSARRRAGADGDDAERPLRTHLAATPAQMGALIAAVQRKNHRRTGLGEALQSTE